MQFQRRLILSSRVVEGLALEKARMTSLTPMLGSGLFDLG